MPAARFSCESGLSNQTRTKIAELQHRLTRPSPTAIKWDDRFLNRFEIPSETLSGILSVPSVDRSTLQRCGLLWKLAEKRGQRGLSLESLGSKQMKFASNSESGKIVLSRALSLPVPISDSGTIMICSYGNLDFLDTSAENCSRRLFVKQQADCNVRPRRQKAIRISTLG